MQSEPTIDEAGGKSGREIVDMVLAVVDPTVDTDYYEDFGRFIDDVRANFMNG